MRVASIRVPSSLAVTDLDPDQAEGLWYGMRSWIDEGFKLLKRGGWQWPATRMTDPDRVERLLLVLAVATRYVLAVGKEADEAEFAGGDDPAVRGPVGPVGHLGGRWHRVARGRARRRRGGAPRIGHLQPEKLRRRRTGTSTAGQHFRQGLAVLMSVLIAGHALPKPS